MTEKSRTIVIAGDIHYPYEDGIAWDAFLKFVKFLKPDEVLLLGDIADFYSVSRFDKDPLKATDLTKELAGLGPAIFGALKSAAPSAKRCLIPGNHEDRLRRYIWQKAPALAGSVLSLNQLYQCQKYGFEFLSEPVGYGSLQVVHGEFLSRHSAMTAKNHLDRYGTSVLVGHSHRLGAFYKTDMRGTHGAWEIGCLCSLTPEYENFPNWQQGFAVVTVWQSGLFNVQLVPIINRRQIVFGGKEWGR